MKKVVFTAISKRNFYARELVCKYVFDNNCVPVNPFMTFGYFLSDLVDRDKIRNANNVLLQKADELWVFGDIANGVAFEIELARGMGKAIRFFTVGSNLTDIIEIEEKEVKIENE